MPYCPECGVKVDSKVKFCPDCGAAIFIKPSGKSPAAAPSAGGPKPRAAPKELPPPPHAEEEPKAPPRRETAQEGAKTKRAKVKIGRKNLMGAIVGIIVVIVIISSMLSVGGGDVGPTTTTTQSTTTPTQLGVLEGATNYTGAYPAAALVSYIGINGYSVNVLAYPEQVQVFFDSSTSQDYAEATIQASGGDVIGAIPLAGYYLAQVEAGSEGAFISAMLADSQVRGAMPNLALEQEQDGVVINEVYLTESKPVPLNVHGPVAIDSGQHARDVVGTADANGGTITDIVNINNLQDYRVPGDKWVLALNAVAQGNAIFNPGATTFINISQGAGYRDDERSGDTNGNGVLRDWSDWTNLPPDLRQEAINNRIAFMSNVLRGVESLPNDLYNDTYITMSGGNNNMPLEPVLSALRANSDWDAILRDTIAIATCPTSLYDQANQGPLGDPSIVVMTNPQAAYGTSFAAPAANAAVQHLTRAEIINIQNATGATFAQVVQAAELAKGANPSNQVIASEVAAMAEAIVNGTVGPGEPTTWSGSYSASHTEVTDPYTRNSGGSMSWNNVVQDGDSFQGDLWLNGITVLDTSTGAFMWSSEASGTVTGSFSDESNFSGTLSFSVPGTVSPPRSWYFTATLSGGSVQGSIQGSASGSASGSFTLTRQ
ncbi:MAG: zinc ribbon domain-containing protein [Methanobacteriota archaeon]